MQDYGLFQAICRTNRLDGEDKDFGYIVDYKDLFKKVENAIAVYTSELDSGDSDAANPEILLQDRLTKGRERLDLALEAFHYLCEPVPPPRAELDFIHYFCGNTEIPEDLKTHEPQRIELYKAIASLIRAYANIADELEAAGYSRSEITHIKQKLDDALKLRDTIRKASGEILDIKSFEADMRHLIDTYIEASEPRKISDFENIPLLDLIVKLGIHKAIDENLDTIKGNQAAVAETIENNVRSTIIQNSLSDPAYYAKMSALLDEIIKARKAKAIDYEDYLTKVSDLARQLDRGKSDDVPPEINTPGRLALFNNLIPQNTSSQPIAAESETTAYGLPDPDKTVELVKKIDHTIKYIRPDNWRGNQAKEQQIKAALYGILQEVDQVERIFNIIEQQAEY